jgi:hypothetical protein
MNMEAEMKERFDKLETLIGKTTEGHANLERLVGKTADGQANLERLVVDVKESLETEMRTGFSDLNTKIYSRA